MCSQIIHRLIKSFSIKLYKVLVLLAPPKLEQLSAKKQENILREQ